MQYPEDMTREDIEQFEYEWERYCDLADPHSLAAVNAELAQLAFEQQVKEAVDTAFESLYN